MAWTIVLRPRSQCAVEIKRRADQRQMSKGLGEITKSLAAMTGLLGVKSEVIGKSEHAFKHQPSLFKPLPVMPAGTG